MLSTIYVVLTRIIYIDNMARRVNMSSTILCVLLILLISNLQKLINNSFLKEKSSKYSNNFVEIHQNLKRNLLLLTTNKCKWLNHLMLYYHNSIASFNVTSSGDSLIFAPRAFFSRLAPFFRASRLFFAPRAFFSRLAPFFRASRLSAFFRAFFPASRSFR